MKTSALIRIFVYSFIALVLTGVLVWGIGGNHNMSFFSFNISNLFGSHGISYNDDNYIIGDGEVAKDKVNEIQVNWTAGNVKVVPYVGDATGRDVIFFTEESGTKLKENYEMRYKVDDGVLKIMFAKSNVKFQGLFKSLDKDLTIHVPIGTTFTGLSIDTISANIDLESIQADILDLETISGDIDGALLTADSLDAETVSGNIRWTDAKFGNVTVESVSGAINTNFLELPSDIHMETVSGAMTLGFPENEGFEVDYDKVSGNFNCEFNVNINKNMATYKNGESKIKLETVSGDMKILAL
jgi:lia operon protein LiaG